MCKVRITDLYMSWCITGRFFRFRLLLPLLSWSQTRLLTWFDSGVWKKVVLVFFFIINVLAVQSLEVWRKWLYMLPAILGKHVAPSDLALDPCLWSCRIVSSTMRVSDPQIARQNKIRLKGRWLTPLDLNLLLTYNILLPGTRTLCCTCSEETSELVCWPWETPSGTAASSSLQSSLRSWGSYVCTPNIYW